MSSSVAYIIPNDTFIVIESEKETIKIRKESISFFRFNIENESEEIGCVIFHLNTGKDITIDNVPKEVADIIYRYLNK